MKRPALGSFRRIAAAVWPRPVSPVIHGFLEVDMTAACAYLEKVRAGGTCRPTVTHLVVRALALAFSRYPEANVRARFWTIWPRESVDIFVQVNLEDGADLSGVLVREADKFNLFELEAQIRTLAGRVRSMDDPLFRRARSAARILPGFLLAPFLVVAEFLSNVVGLHAPWLGIARRPFGSAQVTSVGMLGIEIGFPPFFPLADSVAVLAVGKVHDRPMVVDGEVKVRPACFLGASIDHRLLDGAQLARISKVLRDYLADPAAFEPSPPPGGKTAA